MPDSSAADVPTTRPSGPRGIQSIELGYRILTAIQQGPDAVALKTISARAGMSPSAVHNYLASFIRTGMVAADARGQYRLGPSLAALGLAAARQVDRFELIRTRAVALSEQTGLGVAVLIWSAQGPVILFNKPDPRNHMFELRNGPVSMLSTAGGHVFATLLPREATRPVVLKERGGRMARAECDRLLDSIAAAVRRTGHADVMLDALPGYGALSVPIWDERDGVAYALTITAPVELIDKSPTGNHVAALHAAGRELSRLLGAPAQRWAAAVPMP
ncbi:helix-turn-helix domain-containing protein [Ramlibacter sp. AN1015]|uniref:IclR family transcriptional regulator n=1 Tax=Ramlibacter sp. AN1015 TaxID=3133428 RepID=UPI0030BC9742